MKFGKLPARPDAIKLKFGSFFASAELPGPSVVFGRPDLVTNWKMLANDTHSCCVWSGGAHETMLYRAWAGSPIPDFTDETTLADYGSTGFRADDPDTDQGTDMQVAAEYRRTTGLVDAAGVRHRVDSYVALKAGDIEEVMLAAFTLGAVGIGIEITSHAMDQFRRGEPWTPVSGDTVEGLHYVPLIARNHENNPLIVTWSRNHAVTPAYLAKHMDEGVAYLSFEQMRVTGVSPRGFDRAGLTKAMRQIGQRRAA